MQRALLDSTLRIIGEVENSMLYPWSTLQGLEVGGWRLVGYNG